MLDFNIQVSLPPICHAFFKTFLVKKHISEDTGSNGELLSLGVNLVKYHRIKLKLQQNHWE